ncbi:hypothetical protein OAS39_02260 [Pirellulales bacterium]|nr:hypothetical protein [Pirellulales bacterium]
MKTPLFQIEDFLKVFQQKKVLTHRQMLEAVGCSSMTAWRLLKQHGYFTSYNDNARHYTIDGIPKFDVRGLWTYGGKRFSKWGSLTETIIGLVEESSGGMTAQQLQQLLHVKNVKPALTILIQQQRLTRQKIEGRFVYFPQSKSLQRKQHKQRSQQQQEARAQRLRPPLEQVIALLVEIIQRPHNTPKQWSRRLKQRGIPLGTIEIQTVVDHYGIDLKKGLLKS